MVKTGRTELMELKNQLQNTLQSLSEIGPEGQAIIAQAVIAQFALDTEAPTAKAS